MTSLTATENATIERAADAPMLAQVDTQRVEAARAVFASSVNGQRMGWREVSGQPLIDVAVQAIVRPEALRVHRRPDGGGVRARVLVRRDLGPVHLLHLRLGDGSGVKVRQAGQIEAAVGEEVAIELDPRHLFVYAAGD